MLDIPPDRRAEGGDGMGLLKVVISFVAIGLMGWQMQRNHPDTWKDEDMWRFEIPAAILAAGWIACDGW